MQATVGKLRFNPGQFRIAALIAGVTAIIAAGAIVVTITRDDASTTAPTQTRPEFVIHPEAFQLEQGTLLEQEQRRSIDSIATTSELPDEAIDARLRAAQPTAYEVAGAGEGIVGGNNRDAISGEQPQAYDVSGAGEGIVGSNSREAVSDSRSGTPHRGYEYNHRLFKQDALSGNDAQLVPPPSDALGTRH